MCFWVFHEWVYPSKNTRICYDCGKCQLPGINLLGWYTVKFDTLIRQRMIDEQEEVDKHESKISALRYVRTEVENNE